MSGNNRTCEDNNDLALTAGIVVPIAILTIIIHIAMVATYIGYWVYWRKRYSTSFDKESSTHQSKGSKADLITEYDATATLKALSNKLYDTDEHSDENHYEYDREETADNDSVKV